jgi:hypothetical protein
VAKSLHKGSFHGTVPEGRRDCVDWSVCRLEGASEELIASQIQVSGQRKDARFFVEMDDRGILRQQVASLKAVFWIV